MPDQQFWAQFSNAFGNSAPMQMLMQQRQQQQEQQMAAQHEAIQLRLLEAASRLRLTEEHARNLYEGAQMEGTMLSHGLPKEAAYDPMQRELMREWMQGAVRSASPLARAQIGDIESQTEERRSSARLRGAQARLAERQAKMLEPQEKTPTGGGFLQNLGNLGQGGPESSGLKKLFNLGIGGLGTALGLADPRENPSAPGGFEFRPQLPFYRQFREGSQALGDLFQRDASGRRPIEATGAGEMGLLDELIRFFQGGSQGPVPVVRPGAKKKKKTLEEELSMGPRR